MNMLPRLDGKTVLILGGLGFIGTALTHRSIALGATTIVVDNLLQDHGGNPYHFEQLKNQAEIYIKDIQSADVLPSLISKADFIFDLAAQTGHLRSMQNPCLDCDINVVAKLKILELCRQLNPSVKIIFTSTRQVYGKPQRLPVDETHPVHPVDFNGIHKLTAEWHLQMYHQIYGIPSVILRLTNIYGRGMRIKDATQNFMGFWIRQILEEKPIPIYGDGKQIRDPLHVDDLVQALLLAASSEHSTGQIFNLSGSEPVTLDTLAQKMIQAYGSGSCQYIDFPEGKKSIDIGSYFGDSQKIKINLGWEPLVSLEDGLRDTLEYYQKHQSFYL